MQQAITRTITSITVCTHHHHHGHINTPPTTIHPLARGAAVHTKYHLTNGTTSTKRHTNHAW